MKILKSLTALWRPNMKTVRGSIVAYDGEVVSLLTFEGEQVEVPLSALPGQLKIHQVVTAEIPLNDSVAG